MNLIRKRTNLSGWYSHFKINGKQITRKSPFVSEKKSMKWARELKKHLLNERADPNFIEEIKFKILVEKYLVSKRRINNPHNETKWLLNNFGNPIVSQISKHYIHTKIEQFMIREGRTNARINRMFSQLQAILNWGYDNGYLDRPSKIKKLDVIESDIKKPLNSFEKKKLYNSLPTHLKDPFLFACITGLRKSNVVNLKQENIRNGKIFIKGYYTKQKKDYSYSLDSFLQELLERNIAIDSTNQFVFKGYKDKGYLGDFKKSWETAKRKAGISVRWHDLRHTAGTDMYRQTKDLKKVAELLGHTTTRMAERYTETDKTEQKSDISKMSERMSRVCLDSKAEIK